MHLLTLLMTAPSGDNWHDKNKWEFELPGGARTTFAGLEKDGWRLVASNDGIYFWFKEDASRSEKVISDFAERYEHPKNEKSK